MRSQLKADEEAEAAVVADGPDAIAGGEDSLQSGGGEERDHAVAKRARAKLIPIVETGLLMAECRFLNNGRGWRRRT